MKPGLSPSTPSDLGRKAGELLTRTWREEALHDSQRLRKLPAGSATCGAGSIHTLAPAQCEETPSILLIRPVKPRTSPHACIVCPSSLLSPP